MKKPDRLKLLPPAARVASVRVHRSSGALMVVTRYVLWPFDWEASGICHDSGLWGVPCEVWKQHVGRGPIRLWEWHGTGEGMIGGPAKRQADFTFFGSLWESAEKYLAEELRRAAQQLEDWLADERYEFSSRCRADVERKIESCRRLAGINGWDEMGRSGRWDHAHGFGGHALLSKCDDSEL